MGQLRVKTNTGAIRQVPLAFKATGICVSEEDGQSVLVAGFDDDGATVLLEYRFEVDPEFRIVSEAVPFADVSQLGGITDLWRTEDDGPPIIHLLDGRTVQFGVVERGSPFQSLVGPGIEKDLRGKHSFLFLSAFSDPYPTMRVTTLQPWHHAYPAEEEVIYLRSYDGGRTFVKIEELD